MRVITLASLCLFAFAAAAQTPATQTAPPAPVAPATPTSDATKVPLLSVTGVGLPQYPARDQEQGIVEASLGDSITVAANTTQLGPYLDFAAKQNKSVTLFLNGNDTGLSPEKVDRAAGRLQFHLERTSDNKKLWSSLLRDPFAHDGKRSVNASIGIAAGSPADTGRVFLLRTIKHVWYTWLWFLLLVAVLAWFAFLAVKRGLLRDAPNGPYSLGRCQMAWWFLLIVVSYVVIWLVSGDRDTITASLLGLMGISAATALGSTLIESTTGGGAALQQAAADALALQASETTAIADGQTADAAVTANATDPIAQKRLQDAQAALATIRAKLDQTRSILRGAAAVPKSRNLVLDILSDSSGDYALHRFQIVIWTMVLGIMFIVSVVTELTMLDFSAGLLATMGISSGTYLGFKFPEK